MIYGKGINNGSHFNLSKEGFDVNINKLFELRLNLKDDHFDQRSMHNFIHIKHCCYMTPFSYLQMSELLNQKSAIQGKIPSGYFNALFDLSGDWFRDAQDIKYLAFDGYFISLYYLHLTASHLILQEEVKKSVSAQWDPPSLSR